MRLGDFEGPGFRVADMLVWGFTAFLVEALLQLGGWEIDWEFDHTTVVELTRP